MVVLVVFWSSLHACTKDLDGLGRYRRFFSQASGSDTGGFKVAYSNVTFAQFFI